MLNTALELLTKLDDIFWSYLGVYLILIPGIYFTIKSKGFQFKVLGNFKSIFSDLHGVKKNKEDHGINPFKLYFASVGGMIGLGNIVVVITAVTLGGPGALLWLWLSALAGMLIKYSEIYLGVKHRVPHGKKGYDGGPMYYLKHAFNNKFIPLMSAILMCIYGVEVSQFKIINDTISSTFGFNSIAIMALLIILIFYTSLGGVRRLANYSSLLMPPFMLLYSVVCLYIIISNYPLLPGILHQVIVSSVQGHAPLAGFAGSSMIMALHYGVARAVYSGDIAIGYDSIIQSETKTKHPELQAKLAIFGQLTDTMICTLSILVVLVTGVWTDPSLKDPSEFILKAISLYIPYTNELLSTIFFLAGYTTIIAYFTVGLKSAKFINPKWGKKAYTVCAFIAFISTYYTDQTHLIMIMSLSGGLLVLLNIAGIIKLRKEIKFH